MAKTYNRIVDEDLENPNKCWVCVCLQCPDRYWSCAGCDGYLPIKKCDKRRCGN